MEKIVQKIPFLRPTIALAFGVYLGSILEISILLVSIICLWSLLALITLHRLYKYHLAGWFGLILHLLFISLGMLAYEVYNNKPHLHKTGIFYATVLDNPQEMKNSFKSIIEISHVKTSDSIYQSKEKVLVYFGKNKKVNALKAGDRIAFKSSPKIVQNYGNPYEFDYKSYLSNKRIYRQMYLSSDQWQKMNPQKNRRLIIHAELVREKLLQIYRSQSLGENELEILSALTLGFKRGLDPETKRIFSSAGAMHVLAVSGLHVGIIFWAFSLVFGFLRRSKSGRIIFIISSLFVLWCYTFITGLSPSVMRASTMFSIFVIGDNLNRKANTYNSLLASAMFLLLVNPNNLFEVGFQLSYFAVFGIVFLQPRISKLINPSNKILKFFWSLLTVSISAQLATFPLTTFYFNQFPLYFWGTNLIVIPSVMVLIPLGMLLLVFANIPIIAGILSLLLQYLIEYTYKILQFVEQLPLSTIPISVQSIELFILIGILLSGFLLIMRFKASFIITILFLVLSLTITQLIQNIHQSNSRKMIVYNIPQNLTLQLIAGKENVVISEHRIIEKDFVHNIIYNANLKSGLKTPQFVTQKDSLYNDFVQFKNGIILFDKKKLFFNIPAPNLPGILSPDFIINSNSLIRNKNHFFQNTFIITNKRYFKNKSFDLIHFHNTSTQGAFIQKW